MLKTFAVMALMSLLEFGPAEAPVCQVGNSTAWTGSLADLAGIEAQHQLTQAKEAGQAFPGGTPVLSPWSQFVRCPEGGRA